ncbi:hypothetical protein ACSBR2_013992 [Camellia fascicularis]
MPSVFSIDIVLAAIYSYFCHSVEDYLPCIILQQYECIAITLITFLFLFPSNSLLKGRTVTGSIFFAGRVLGVDLIEQITKRCIRIVKNPEDAEVIACVLCRDATLTYKAEALELQRQLRQLQTQYDMLSS